MGEYAKRKSDGVEVKIGTCEDMYYLRADQAAMVAPLTGSVDPAGRDRHGLRFRFPWPDEDGTPPGEFQEYGRTVPVDVRVPSGVEHRRVPFTASAGYLMSIPCPEGSMWRDNFHGAPIHRNGFRGSVLLVQQKLLRDGRLVPVCGCGGCGALFRVEEPTEIEALAAALRSEGDRRRESGTADFWHTVADRVLEGAQLRPHPDDVPEVEL